MVTLMNASQKQPQKKKKVNVALGWERTRACCLVSAADSSFKRASLSTLICFFPEPEARWDDDDDAPSFDRPSALRPAAAEAEAEPDPAPDPADAVGPGDAVRLRFDLPFVADLDFDRKRAADPAGVEATPATFTVEVPCASDDAPALEPDDNDDTDDDPPPAFLPVPFAFPPLLAPFPRPLPPFPLPFPFPLPPPLLVLIFFFFSLPFARLLARLVWYWKRA